ncbi:MAG: hypothetical protein IJ970_01445, partial [Mycoplasmataceae bacterium]|nr:hypothetical protein [Mycoplasmataceae bacterium]
MKKKSKVIIASSILAAGAVATTAALIPSMLKKETQNITIETKDIKNPVVIEKNEQLESKNEINSELPKTEKVEYNSTTDQQDKKFKLSFKELNDKSKDKATFKFLKDNETTDEDEVMASFGDKVSFKVEYKNSKENITLTDLRVYVDNNEAWSLGVYYDSSRDIYEITIPSKDSDWAKELEDRKDVELNFRAYFGPKFINYWIYDFNSRTYAIKITQDNFVFDDVKNEGHRIVALEENQTYIKPTQFRVYLDGHDIKIKNLTIPEGTQLMFINQPEYSNTLDNKKAPIIDLEGGYRSMDEADGIQ